MPSRAEPVKIVGAGPSGLAAAIVLAQKNIAVRVHEAKPNVGTRWKRGLQLIENFSETPDVLESFRSWGIQTDFAAQPVSEITLYDDRGRKTHFKSDGPLGYYVHRGARPGALDQSLLDQARRAGAEVIFNSPQERESGARVWAAGPRRVDGMGKEVTFQTDLSDRMSVILDSELAPGGYAYLFVAQGEATLGMAVLKEYKQIDGFYEKTVARFRDLEAVRIDGGEVSYSYANFFVPKTVQSSGCLLAGEAGGFQDYLFGFGIRYAIESGVLAAKSIETGVSYDDLCGKSLFGKKASSLVNRFLYERGGRLVPRVFIGLALKSSSLRGYLRGWYGKGPVRSLAAKALVAFKPELAGAEKSS